MKDEIRVIEWVAPGYEGAYTQYAICPAFEGAASTDSAVLYITQIATKPNMAFAMMVPRPVERRSTVGNLRIMVDELIKNRCEDGSCREVNIKFSKE